MAKHMPNPKHLSAIANISTEFISSVLCGTPDVLLGSNESLDLLAERAYYLAQAHIERCAVIYDVVTGDGTLLPI